MLIERCRKEKKKEKVLKPKVSVWFLMLQMPVDYVCSACHRAQREEVIVIRLEEQENLWSVQLDNLWTDEKVEEKEGSEPVCCICGCEDNEDLEALVLATCPGLMETLKIAC
jgi:hypothetical protein